MHPMFGPQRLAYHPPRKDDSARGLSVHVVSLSAPLDRTTPPAVVSVSSGALDRLSAVSPPVCSFYLLLSLTITKVRSRYVGKRPVKTELRFLS